MPHRIDPLCRLARPEGQGKNDITVSKAHARYGNKGMVPATTYCPGTVLLQRSDSSLRICHKDTGSTTPLGKSNW